MTPNKQPIFIHPNFHKLSGNLVDLLRRFEQYGKQLEFLTEGKIKKLTLFVRPISELGSVNLANYSHLKIHQVPRFYVDPILFSFYVYWKIRKMGSKGCTLIAGDLSLGLIDALLLKHFLGSDCNLQISFHGFDPQKTMISILRKKIINSQSHKFDSVRVVSPNLIELVSNFYKILPSKIFVAPIPLSPEVFRSIPRKTKEKSINFLILGRLHSERGILGAIPLLKRIIESFIDSHIHFIGTGPLENEIQELASSLGILERFHFHGMKTQHELCEMWSNFAILLNFAPLEGYGMAIREACLNGLNVVALKNSGTLRLKQIYGDSIYVFENDQEFISQVSIALKSPMSIESIINLRSLQKTLDYQSIDQLTRSWI